MAAIRRKRSLSGFLLGLGLSVGQSNVKLLASLHDSQSLGNADTLSNLSAVSSVVHKEKFAVLLVRDQQLFEAVW